LVVEEADGTGYLRIKILELRPSSMVIVVHVRNRQGQRIDGWAQASALANFWRMCFNISENTWPHHDYDDSREDGPQATDPVTPGPNQPQIPTPLIQLPHLLYSVLEQDPDGNDSILAVLNAASSSTSSATLNLDGLAHLAGHLAFFVQHLRSTKHRALRNH